MGQFGQVLREIRTERGLTQGQLAYKAATTPEYISMLETGDRIPSTRLLVRLTNALSTTPDYLLRRAGMLDIREETLLAPEVQRIADVWALWPETHVKANARQMIIAVAGTLEYVRELDAEGKVGPNKDAEPEVQRVAHLLAACSEGELKAEVRAIITTFAETLEHVLDMLKGESENAVCEDQPASRGAKPQSPSLPITRRQ